MPTDRWLLPGGPGPVQIFCFPPGGGDPRTFLDWQEGLDGIAQVEAVCMPGRSLRSDERAPERLVDVAAGAAEAIAAAADRPFLFFGHSMGAIVAFETARRLGPGAGPRHLVASGSNAPVHNPSEYIVWSDGNHGRVFAREAASFLGLPAEFLEADDEVQELLLADLRADVHLIAEYRYEAGPPLDLGITVICGRDDPHVDRAGVAGWQAESRQDVAVHWTGGDHFYLDKDPAPVLDLLRTVALGITDDDHVEVI